FVDPIRPLWQERAAEQRVDPGDCLGSSQPEECSVPRAEAAAPDTVRRAVRSSGHVAAYIDMTNMNCRPDRCDTIVGNVIACRDTNPLSATYAERLAPYLHAAIAASLSD